MSFRCASLGSGSKGNATLIATDSTHLLIDCGFGLKEIQNRLASKGVLAEELSAILVTHEHGDHASGVARLSKKFNIPVWMTRGTSLHKSCESISNLHLLNGGQEITIGDIHVLPFTVPHDSREPVQFVFHSANKKIGLLTDTGRITSHTLEMLTGCQLLLLEFNHDTGRLANSKYPMSLKQRIGGDLGHLSNYQSLQLLKRLKNQRLQQVIALHLSEENNCPELVARLYEEIMIGAELQIASQEAGTKWIAVA